MAKEGGEGYIQTAGGEGKDELLSCNWEGLLKDLDYHLQNECLLKGEKCKYWELLGCSVTVNPKTKTKHEKEDTSLHLDFAINELASAKQEIAKVICPLLPYTSRCLTEWAGTSPESGSRNTSG